DDALLLDRGTAVAEQPAVVADMAKSPDVTFTIERDGIYQIDVSCASGESQGRFYLRLGEREFAGELYESKPAAGEDAKAAFGLVRLSKGDFKLSAKYGNNS